METLLSLESVRKVWDARDRPLNSAREHVYLNDPNAKKAESWAAAGKARIGVSLSHAPTSRSDRFQIRSHKETYDPVRITT